jgi:quercetin dioxygenase-like cupin family protein
MEETMNPIALTRKAFLIVGTAGAVVLAGVVAHAALPGRDVNPINVPLGTLAGATSVDVLSLSAFTRAINQAHGTTAVLQHTKFAAGQSTLWHTHPGPNLVLVVAGSLILTDQHCNVTMYTDGQGFSTGLKTHLAVAGPAGADFYALYFLPSDADALRHPPAGVDGDAPNCAS